MTAPEKEKEISPRERERMLREILFVPCDSKEHLANWVREFLGLDLPDTTVCHTDSDFEPSNSNPLDLLWEVYEAARKGDRTKTRFLYYAARGCYKSVLASVIEALCLFHLRRDVGHMAANKKQSKIVQKYLKDYLQRPILRDFMTSKNESEISVTWYENEDGGKLNPAEFKQLTEDHPDLIASYVEKSYMVTVVVATLGGANGLHCSMMVMDELDLTPAEIISEAMMIPAPGKEYGEPAMVLMTSSRKFAIGPVQTAIDDAHKTGMNVRHWNVIDVARACPPERHLPERKKLKVYYSNDHLTTISEKEYGDLPLEERETYKPDVAFEGCIKNCKMFAMCRGRLADQQKSTSNLLRHPADVQDLFQGQPDTEKAQAQLMCWKPSRAGMIYPRLSRKQHLVTAARIAEIITGEPHPPHFGKSDLMRLLATEDARYYVGIDHGFNHCFAGTLGVRWGAYMFVVDAFAVPGLELDGKIRIMESRFKKYDPDVFADTSHPGDNKSIGKAGFKMRKWTKGPGSVYDGIGIVRMKLNPVLSKQPELFFLAGDPGVEELFDNLMKYAWVIDPNTGEPTKEPNEKDDDGPDSLRYMVMNVFAPKGTFRGSTDDQKTLAPRAPVMGLEGDGSKPVTQQQVRQFQWNQVMEHVGMGGEKPLEHMESDDPATTMVRGRGRFVFDLG